MHFQTARRQQCIATVPPFCKHRGCQHVQAAASHLQQAAHEREQRRCLQHSSYKGGGREVLSRKQPETAGALCRPRLCRERYILIVPYLSCLSFSSVAAGCGMAQRFHVWSKRQISGAAGVC